MALKKKEKLRLPAPETGIEFPMAACAPAAEVDFQSVDMMDIRLSTASGALHLEPSSDAQADEQEWDEDTSGCFAYDRLFFALAASFTGATPESI